jgi:hypothetical protein
MTAEQRLIQHLTGVLHGYELAKLTSESRIASQAVRGHLRRVCRSITDPQLAEIYRQAIEDGYAAGKATRTA